MENKKLPSLFLRIGLAAVFIYAAVAAFLDPFSWIGFFPQWLRALAPDQLLLFGHSVSELILGLWLLSGWKTFYASILASLALLSIVVFNFGALDIIFRDIGLFLSAAALAMLTREKTYQSE